MDGEVKCGFSAKMTAGKNKPIVSNLDKQWYLPYFQSEKGFERTVIGKLASIVTLNNACSPFKIFFLS